MTLTCGALMRPIRTWLHQDDLVGKALDFMMERHMPIVPVVDSDHKLVGLISNDRLMHRMLPKELTVVRGLDRMGYLRETIEDLHERLEGLASQPLSEVMITRVRTVSPEDALIDAQVILAEAQTLLPVVEPETGRLLGIISAFTILAAVRGEDAWSDRVEQFPVPSHLSSHDGWSGGER